MSDSFDHFKGEIILQATMKAKEGKVDHILNGLRKIKQHSDSSEEPGCLSFRICRSGNSILIFEKYVDQNAVIQHFNSKPFGEFDADARPFLEDFKLTYYEEDTA
ncbi:hypothetical protein BOTBODRAFT_28796 [Botryobasidium botryosum FD-172 SS1]|uniref:ABM domain-containing protein n=1 Tax=Botryobasidium botryosum (strain FD-172 SS1) TaxID=930990 RepID=A0A067N3R2_BOTB1|nr:hypothetical protein BOTBODRAFT_28796 [Botryobasidium botryosum FD-172 SS1]